MEKRRVYQVAKEKKLSSDALISMLKSMDFEVKSHMSVVTQEMLDAITRKIDDETRSSIEEVQRQKVKETQRKAEARAARQVTEPPKEEVREPSRPQRQRPETEKRPSAEASPPAPARTTEEAGKRRSRRRGKTAEEEAQPERREGATPERTTSALSELSGRWRSGGSGRQRRRKQVDSQAVQDSVRKTLSQISEGRTRRRYDRTRHEDGEEVGAESARELRINEYATVAEFAETMGVRPAEVIAACLQLGVVVTINQRLDMDTMATVGDEFGFAIKALEAEEEEEEEEEFEEEESQGEQLPRPPVVTVMGHVDHGKTSLLDYLRKTDVVSGESGGITQHIGAYSVTLEGGRAITFLDTPGHAAFTAMRARGARVTDLVILVVAADDAVMPQTIEAINHAKAAGVPMVVAINKIDLPTADPERIKRELAEQGVLLDEWGGNVSSAQISAKTGKGIEKLLEMVLLEAEMRELRADPYRRARGTIVEAQLDRGRGAVATVLVQEGTLRQGDPIVTGMHGGRVRALLDEHGRRLKEAGPSIPVQVLGLSGVPQAGDLFVVTKTEREVRDIIQRRQAVRREQDTRRRRTVTLGDLHHQIQEGRIKELNVVVKGDVDGSVEAVTQELGGITHAEVRIAIIHSSVGPVSESDVLLASASDAIIIAYRVPVEASSREMAGVEGVDIREYTIIYEVVEELRAALSGLLAPSLQEIVVGSLEVREIFTSSRAGTIAGCRVQKGKINRNNRVRVRRGNEIVFEGGISSLRRFKDDVREVLEGFECGIALEGYSDLQAGDLLEVVEVVQEARTL
ncbi:MAG: translation initiation factor IF-2 [Gemmatimonadota bacterium]